MSTRIRNQQDFAAGIVYILAGAGFALGALNYKLGDPARMGPGWFPFWVGVLLAAVGVWTLASGMRARAAPAKVKSPDLRAMAWILGAVILFGLMLQPAGLIASIVVLVLVSSRASHEFSWRGAFANAAFLTVFSTAAFIWGINLQIALWPSFLMN
ncbi:tripartite tricarboxylate transporter TctB family protein [Ramlibacter sp.]|uniref:tripartite tricarboxylate transporter TctB family protein n=1 Tax=Ramlibacter sp. TaxID=1917967 RepID=UPI003D0D3C31